MGVGGITGRKPASSPIKANASLFSRLPEMAPQPSLPVVPTTATSVTTWGDSAQPRPFRRASASGATIPDSEDALSVTGVGRTCSSALVHSTNLLVESKRRPHTSIADMLDQAILSSQEVDRIIALHHDHAERHEQGADRYAAIGGTKQ